MTNQAELPPPGIGLSLGITGHRAGHPGFAAAQTQISAALGSILDEIDRAIRSCPMPFVMDLRRPTRLHTLLADGTDRMAAEMGLARGYELVSPLPFGRRLNKSINALPQTAADARALLAGSEASDAEAQAHADAIRALSDRSRIFSLADADSFISRLYLEKLDAPEDAAKALRFAAEASRRVALAGRILIEQSDIVIAVWDGVTTAHLGGTGHTIQVALELGAPVIWIDPARPADWQLLRAPEALARVGGEATPAGNAIETLVRGALLPGDGDIDGVRALEKERWRSKSSRFAHAYRRVEVLFAGEGRPFRGLSQRYETAEAIAGGSYANFRSTLNALPAGDTGLDAAITTEVLKRFAWSDGVSARLSDSYRGGMIVNFVLSSLAIVIGTAYLPFVAAEQKWLFAAFELLLLCAILLITFAGSKRRWHGRWFETRRVAEYLRHAPILLALGSARAPGRWPRGAETSWPEWYVRHALRNVGLPRVAVTASYLRGALTGLLSPHVTSQRDYHWAKAKRLTTVHHNLDRWSSVLFQLAVISVALYLALRGAEALGWIDGHRVEYASKYFTVLGVLFPTFGAGIAGIRYFGDFERFAAISEVTAEKLDAVHGRIALLADAPDAELNYGRVSELAQATDDIVFAEIENWQAVFGGKHITVPV